jgi:hypothetical protein
MKRFLMSMFLLLIFAINLLAQGEFGTSTFKKSRSNNTFNNVVIFKNEDGDIVITINPDDNDGPKIIIADSNCTDFLQIRDNIISTSAKELTLEETGDDYGTSRLKLLNRVGFNGAIFDGSDGEYSLIDFIFKTKDHTRILRLESRTNSTLTGSVPEWHIGGTDAKHAIFVINDNNLILQAGTSTANNGDVGIGTIAPHSHSLTLGSENNQYDLIVTREFTPSIIDSCIQITYNMTDDVPELNMKQGGGHNQRVQYALEGWVISSTQNSTIGILPANAIVTNIFVWVNESFNSDGSDELTVGYDTDNDAYMTALDVSASGVKTPTLGSTSRTVDATNRMVELYYVNGGSEPDQGKAHVVVEYIQATAIP